MSEKSRIFAPSLSRVGQRQEETQLPYKLPQLMKKIRLLTILFMAIAVSMGCTSCEKTNQDDVDNGYYLEVKIRNGGSLEDNCAYLFSLRSIDENIGITAPACLSINNADNFYIYSEALEYHASADIVCIGKASVMDKINDIPNSGWSVQAPVKEGYGYIARGKDYDGTLHYARLYVVNRLTNSSGGVIGATIRYEPDWK